MATWVGTIVMTNARPDLWLVAARHGVRHAAQAVPAYVLIGCDYGGFDFHASIRLAEVLSRELSTMALGFVVQTASDVHELQTFVRGSRVRHLAYTRDHGGWIVVEGEPQSWENAYFFDEGTTGAGGPWPDLLDDNPDGLPTDDAARYEEAKRRGDASPVISLLHPGSTTPMLRVCESLGIDASKPAGQWTRVSFWSRLLGRG